MGATLNGKIKIGFIDGSIPKPAEIDPLFCSGMRNKNTISSWLLNSISKEISASVIYVENITEIWKEFHDPFQHKNGPCVYQLKKSILNFTQGHNESFNQVHGQILLMDPLPSINVVLSMVSQYEKQREVITLAPIEVQGPEAFPQANNVSDRYATNRDTPLDCYFYVCSPLSIGPIDQGGDTRSWSFSEFRHRYEVFHS
ncbi:hypothetical protein KIW84_061971 [Lathyrus oleraceus]|uniref:Uncharacterized protein n=1 Tax=Pisum sativum TaxID=3888 RepID=A0A9D4W7D8_PEA|nr:hypothetical protein KIW84_061971 [Pisum sativum]